MSIVLVMPSNHLLLCHPLLLLPSIFPQHQGLLKLHIKLTITGTSVQRLFKPLLELFANVPLTNGEGNGNPLQYSCLENPLDGGAW